MRAMLRYFLLFIPVRRLGHVRSKPAEENPKETRSDGHGASVVSWEVVQKMQYNAKDATWTAQDRRVRP